MPVSKVRQAMKTNSSEEMEGEVDRSGGLSIDKMYEPEKSGRAEMISGSLKDIADRMVEIFKSQDLI